MSGFWDKKNIVPQEQAYQQALAAQPVTLDEEALAEIQGDEDRDVFEDEDADMAEVLSDANLRLEQGRLYQMIMGHDIFGETDADPKAIRNVQREIRRFARHQMEIMLGMRQQEPTQQTIVSSPFNDMEVTVLKLLASKMSKGATEQETAPLPPSPKKDGITAIAGNTRPKGPTPLNSQPKPKTKPQAKAQPVQTKIEVPKEEASSLKKPIDQMTPQELAEYDKAAAERNSKKYATLPQNMVPMPSAAQLEALYMSRSHNMPIKLVPPSE